MAFMKTEQYESTPNILESEVGLVLKTYTAEQTNAETVGTKKIIKADSSLRSSKQTSSDKAGTCKSAYAGIRNYN